jgi:hypothetical protein
MKVFIELLHGEIPLKKEIPFIDNRGKGMATIGTPDWAQVFSPVFSEKGSYTTKNSNTVTAKFVGRIYIEKKILLEKLGKQRLTKVLLNSPAASAVFEDALKSVLKK